MGIGGGGCGRNGDAMWPLLTEDWGLMFQNGQGHFYKTTTVSLKSGRREYLGDGTVHPGDHLLFIHELCELFKCAGISRNQVKRKLFSLSLKGRAAEWYKTLKDG
jgi:hypothetical protein